ncbi:MAG TPA: MFS transporter [Solirubrobacteraceae bacterium]
MKIARRYPRFRRLLASLAVSQAGDWLYNLALLAFVYERTHSSAWLGVTTAARVLPIVVCGPLGGVLADRYDRRRIMIASDAIRLGLMLALAAVAATGLPIVLAPVIAALSTAASSAYMPCVAASTPRLVDDADLPAANALRSAIGQVCIVAGPGFGALLLLVGSPSLAFALNGATFALSALAVASLPAGPAFAPGGEPEQAPNVLRELGAGARALLHQPVALRLVGADVMASAVYGAETVLLLLLSRELGLGDHGYGYLLASCGLGGVLGAGVAGRAAASGRTRTALVGSLAVLGACTVLLGAPLGIGVALVLGLVSGACSIVVEVVADTGLQRVLPQDVLARAYGIAFPAALAGIVAGSLVAAPLAALFGLQGAFAALGGVTALYAMTLLRRPEPVVVAPAPRPAAA